MIVASIGGHGQDTDQIISGEVSFVTSNNVYIKFDDTEKINVGDTLQLSNNNALCLIVKNKSSSSIVCSLIDDCAINKGDKVSYSVKYMPVPISTVEESIVDDNIELIEEETKSLYKEKIKGRISVSNYNNIASERSNRYRLTTRFSLNASHINNSKFSFDTYMNYRYKFPVEQEGDIIESLSYFRIYNLAVRYDASPTLSLTLGRRTNGKAWSLGAIDGLQAEKIFGKTYLGAIVGFRPDIYNYGFNANLFEYGAYFGLLTKNDNIYTETTLGYLEQRNDWQTDRRYGFFQFSSTFYNKLTVFSSIELDLYSKVNGVASTEARLTNFYASARYRFSRKLDLFVSYDSRKRIIYYETYESEIDRMLDDDIARQGVRARLNYRPYRNLSFGLSYSKRYEVDKQNKSDNIYAYGSYSNIPTIGGRIAVSYNMNKSNYLESRILSIRYARVLIKKKLNGEFYYRLVDYLYYNSVANLKQNYFGANLSYNMSRTLAFSISGEISTLNSEDNYRIYAKVVKRFYGKDK